MHNRTTERLDPFFGRIERRDTLGPAERQALVDGVSAIEEATAGADLVREGDRPARSTLLVSGFAARYRTVANGERQFATIHVAGDFVDLHSFPLKEMDHSVLALTPCTLAMYPHEAIKGMTERLPHLTRLLWLLTLLDSALQREWIVCMGRLSAEARALHLFCELGARLAAVGLGQPDNYHLPLTQQDLADALGLSSVHANRVVQSLRKQGLLIWQAGQLVLPNLQAAREMGEFDERYLHLIKEPR
ncbi:Crp/Fnr family transcriptional regulator [Devosia naphthalenivorans]|uniref:Crp/Fnr family transcriptional regulator n=1 Tax=Devosia naphthalenivorans TaxID=2082392 RepID=UPI000D3321AA|nr:Crp/Fnr family transcriptional regulator [Devosia naphthalenivorans]